MKTITWTGINVTEIWIRIKGHIWETFRRWDLKNLGNVWFRVVKSKEDIEATLNEPGVRKDSILGATILVTVDIYFQLEWEKKIKEGPEDCGHV